MSAMITRMSSKRLVLISLVVSCLQAPSARSAEIHPNTGVLCLWSLYLSMQIVGDYCFPDRHVEFRTNLTSTLKKLDELIIKNAPTDRNDLEKEKERIRSQTAQAFTSASADEKIKMCSVGMIAETYTNPRVRETVSGHIASDSIDKFLSKPRKPTVNVCL